MTASTHRQRIEDLRAAAFRSSLDGPPKPGPREAPVAARVWGKLRLARDAGCRLICGGLLALSMAPTGAFGQASPSQYMRCSVGPQAERCAVQLRNGQTLHGYVQEHAAGGSMTLRTDDNQIFVLGWSDFLRAEPAGSAPTAASERPVVPTTTPAVSPPRPPQATTDADEAPLRIRVLNPQADMHVEVMRRVRRGNGDTDEVWDLLCRAPCASFPARYRTEYRIRQDDTSRSDSFGFDAEIVSADLSLRRGYRRQLPLGLTSLSVGGTAVLALGITYPFWVYSTAGPRNDIPVGAIAAGVTLGLGGVLIVYGIVGTVLGRTGVRMKNVQTLSAP